MARRGPLPLDFRLAPFHVSEASARGVSLSRLRAADLVRPFRGVRATSAPETVLDRCNAYAARMPAEHWFSHATAAQLWGLPLPARLERDGRVHVSSSGREPEVVGVVGHRIRRRPHVRRHRGLSVLGPAETWCQLGSVLTVDELVEAGERLIGWPEPLCSPEEVAAAIARFGSRRGARNVREAGVRLRERSASPQETRLRELLVRAALPEPELNAPITLAGGVITHGDLVYAAYRVVVEYDGEQHRLDPEVFHRDVDRLNALAVAGWIVVRIRKGMADDDVIRVVSQALESGGWRP
ncbi:endonuclease domain-containing protein [Agromyces aurantiacus]|uniref:Endonuclease domain-containing protein n=1 Tax=Agromyces aurantiacus TaxID=165814 RepID=A0ABV9R3W5_9MICO|nr:DUF559 domain-containing protein [Agromyces aurantiacus]MBM7502821.1 very-short-patch-repair endonuclease [Agromyces aurantiacus]